MGSNELPDLAKTDQPPGAARHSTGVAGLDAMLGGGLLPGALTVVVGATGIGKTQLGLHFAHAGLQSEGAAGVIFDVCARGDSQSHADYAKRMFNWHIKEAAAELAASADDFFARCGEFGEYLHVFDYAGRRVTRRDLEWDDWRHWQSQLNQRLQRAIAFLYGHLVRGVERVIVDGVEPVDRPQDSIQFQLFEYVYHQVLRKDPEWVARDYFRESYRAHAEQAAQHRYDAARPGCLLLTTSHETMLDDLITMPLHEGDLLSNANTLILMGKVRRGDRVGRALHIAKHRGSQCDDRIATFVIDDGGLRVD